VRCEEEGRARECASRIRHHRPSHPIDRRRSRMDRRPVAGRRTLALQPVLQSLETLAGSKPHPPTRRVIWTSAASELHQLGNDGVAGAYPSGFLVSTLWLQRKRPSRAGEGDVPALVELRRSHSDGSLVGPRIDADQEPRSADRNRKEPP